MQLGGFSSHEIVISQKVATSVQLLNLPIDAVLRNRMSPRIGQSIGSRSICETGVSTPHTGMTIDRAKGHRVKTTSATNSGDLLVWLVTHAGDDLDEPATALRHAPRNSQSGLVNHRYSAVRRGARVRVARASGVGETRSAGTPPNWAQGLGIHRIEGFKSCPIFPVFSRVISNPGRRLLSLTAVPLGMRIAVSHREKLKSVDRTRSRNPLLTNT